jgi:hypothetical protein
VEIRAGYDIAFQCFQDTPMTLMLSIDPARVGDLLSEHSIQFSPDIPSRDYRDVFGNTCTRIVAPPGLIEIRNEFLIADSGLPDEVALEARQLEVGDLPDDMLVYLLGSRYCNTQNSLTWPGRCSAGLLRAGNACRRSATMPMSGSASATSTRAAIERHRKAMRNASASAATSRTSPLRCAGA